MKIIRILTVTLLATTLTAGVALAGPRGNRGGGARANPNRASITGTCPAGNVPGTGAGKSIRGAGNPNSTGTPLRDGSGKATAPGNGARDGTGNNPRHPVAPSTTPAG
jgi:hypothetical protein